ncbi:nitrate- and nitrite sensing domain-containing protein [Streptomyces sp. NPDC000410]|uniref:nitrate- and nitrite sensing domain-containing protein n=1 Tax=Streptomyces sp. NPDC000410 TaxID=3154254 RepID=UPI00331BF0F7
MQGRFKRDSTGSPQARKGRGEAAAEQLPHGGTDRGSSPQHAQNQGPAGDGGDRGTRTGAPSGAEPAASPTPGGPADAGSRIALRNWRISTRLVSLLTLPVVAATTLGGFRINESMADMEQLEHMQLLTKMTREATALAQALQNERDHAAGPLMHGGKATDFKVAQPRKVTDQRKAAFLDATNDIGDTTGDEALESIRANVAAIAAEVHKIDKLRSTAYQQRGSSAQTIANYGRLIDSLLSLSQDMAQATSNPDMIKRTRALAAFSSAKEFASMQRAVIAAALPANAQEVGNLSENDRLVGEDAKSNEEAEMRQFGSIYSSYGGNAEALLAPLTGGNSEIEKADSYRTRVLRNTSLIKGEKRSYLDWTDQADTKIQTMNVIEADLLDQMDSKARELKNESQQEAIINGALILLVLGVSLVGAFVVARSMIRSLRRLQDTATKVAQDRLPELVKQLSEADPQDVDTQVESVGVHSRDEIGQVAAAFDDVHREAVRLAAEQALLRGNVNAMFTNLSRRSQGLIQRQLSLISELESREADPDQLSSLFKLDHLATRMRRNGENLLVLAGEEPGRRWTRPVPLVDVLRAAASEVEQYERIELASVPATEVAGRVVNDLVHLLAELLENATSFSSPQTKVRVTGHALPDGRVLVEIHDTGIGLSPEDLAAINERLASPPTVDVSVSRRMGLFVVGRLSLRHGIRIQLRPSDSGGTTALVMLPVDVAHGGKKPPAKPGAGAQNGAPQAPAGPAGGRPGLGGGPAGGPGGRPGPGGASVGRPAAGAPIGQVGAGQAPRAALPGRDGGPLQGGPQQDPSREPARQGGAPTGAFGADSGRGRHGAHAAPAQGAQDRNDGRQDGRAPGGGRQGSPAGSDRGRQLPPTGAPRAELPGGAPQQPRQPRPETTSWGSEQSSAPQRPSLDAPRGHEEPESTGQYARPTGDLRQDPGATAEFPRPDFSAPRQDPAATEQFARPDFSQPRPPAPAQPNAAPRQRGRDTADFGVPRPPAASLPAQQQPEALPPASGPGDGRTPLFDTLETNWFHGAPGGQADGGAQPPAVPQQQPVTPATPPRRPAAPTGHTGQPQAGNPSGAAWRTSPNDELVRQAERVRKPAAGGITTSGLPKRVPRANLVPGTAQEQNHQTGPQVSRAPDDVRGRLTNLRRGIQQGRQAGGSGDTGSFNLGPTHQQER